MVMLLNNVMTKATLTSRDFTLSRVIPSHHLINEVTTGGLEFILSSSPPTCFVDDWPACCLSKSKANRKSLSNQYCLTVLM